MTLLKFTGLSNIPANPTITAVTLGSILRWSSRNWFRHGSHTRGGREHQHLAAIDRVAILMM
jgi:hypothetical protein